jgi:dynein heavy chain
MQLTATIQQFSKLPKIEIGNTKGATMSSSIVSVSQEFDEAVLEFTNVDYDIIDIEKRQFEDDFYKFRKRTNELERRLSSVLTQSFDDCDTLVGKFKLLESFDGLLTRPIISQELEKKQGHLLSLYKDDLKLVLTIFQEGKLLIINPDVTGPISSNMPPIAGAINWTSGLFERISGPFDRLNELPDSVRDREEYLDVQKMYKSLCKQLKEFEDEKILEWEADVEENTSD